jgi:hypothetical protein
LSFYFWFNPKQKRRGLAIIQPKKNNATENRWTTKKKFFPRNNQGKGEKKFSRELPALRAPVLTLLLRMVTTNAPRATTQLTLQRYALTAVEEKWTASRLAREADCHIETAEKFLSRLAEEGLKKTQREVFQLAESYRSTLERTAARSREYLESIAHLELDQLDKDQRSLRKDALSSLSSLSSMLRLEITGDTSASTPPRLGNL